MPIHLPAISRRQFLKASLSSAAVALTGGCAFSDHHPRQNAHQWALLSDIHIAADSARIERGVNMTRKFESVMREILAWPTAPSGVLINGDLAFNNGELADYAAVLKLVQPLREYQLPIHMALGNHDNRDRFWSMDSPDKTIQPAMIDKQVSIIRTARVNWFILDSLLTTRETPGCLGDTQREWLAGALDANANKPAIIAIHHQPSADVKNGLQDTQHLLAILRPRRHVKAYVFGHTHRWEVSRDESGLHLINLPAVSYVFEKEQPTGWVHATFRPDGVRLELRCLDHENPSHGQVKELAWRS